MAVDITNNTDEHRYEARVDGALAGAAYYKLHEGVIEFDHTEVDDSFEGKGVGSGLARGALDDVRRGLGEWTVMVAREPSSGRLVGAVRGRVDSHGEWDIGRVMVAPDLQGRGLGRALLELVEALAPADVTTYVLFTGAGSTDNLRMYKKAGFRLRADRKAPPGAVVLTKDVRKRISR